MLTRGKKKKRFPLKFEHQETGESTDDHFPTLLKKSSQSLSVIQETAADHAFFPLP